MFRIGKWIALSSCLAIACILLLGHCSVRTDWRGFQGDSISAVAWSPDGAQIAFIATPNKADEDGYVDPQWAEIWLLNLHDSHSLRKLIHIARSKVGIPTSLFWLSGSELGWSSSSGAGGDNHAGFALYALSTKDSKLSRLCSCWFQLLQTRAHEVCAPDDVYFDASSHSIMCSGCLFGGEEDGRASRAIVLVYNTETKLVEVIPLQSDVVNICGVSGTIKDANPSLYICATTFAMDRLRSMKGIFWHSKSWSLSRDQLLPGGGLFPRPSPDATQLAWLSDGPDPREKGSIVTEILVYDLKKKTKTSVARIPNNWSADDPGLGCPFAWSPNGQQIAYADGSEVKFVRIAKR